MFPYPDVLPEENKENLTAMVDAFSSFFETENDPLHNDQIATVPDEIMQGAAEMGAFGLQVPEELEGLGLNNTEYARLTEIVGENDLGFGIVMGAHQSIGFKVSSKRSFLAIISEENSLRFFSRQFLFVETKSKKPNIYLTSPLVENSLPSH